MERGAKKPVSPNLPLHGDEGALAGDTVEVGLPLPDQETQLHPANAQFANLK